MPTCTPSKLGVPASVLVGEKEMFLVMVMTRRMDVKLNDVETKTKKEWSVPDNHRDVVTSGTRSLFGTDQRCTTV